MFAKSNVMPLEQVASDEPRGQLTAAVRFEFRTATGDYRARNVRVHNEYQSTMVEAQSTIRALRENNEGLHVMGKFTVNL